MRVRTIGLALVLLLLAAACSSSDGASSSASEAATSPSGDPNTDKLAQILERGTLVLSTDLAYPPQSYGVEGATRAEPTTCTAEQLTAPEVGGYDAEVGKLVADEWGVEPCFVAPEYTQIVAGNWGDRWDISWASGGINEDRMTRLWMTQPYYAAPQSFFVHEDPGFDEIDDLDGATIGVCADCSHQLYLEGTLEVPGIEIEYKVDDPDIAVYNVEGPGLQDVADGKIDAFLLSEPVGLAAIDDGLPLREIEEPAFPLYLDGFVDKSSSLDQAAFVDRVNETILALIQDGSLPALSEEYFGTDYASSAADFDIDALGQEVT